MAAWCRKRIFYIVQPKCKFRLIMSLVNGFNITLSSVSLSSKEMPQLS